MHELHKQFIEDSEKKAFDTKHRSTIGFNMSKYDAAVEKGVQQFGNIELARDRLSYLKNKVLNNLDEYLVKFETNFTNNGGHIIWAENNKQAIEEIIKVLVKNLVKKVVKSKSMTTEEIEFNEALEEKHIESLETDFGEYIVQLAGEKPYHIVTPAMHKSKEDIAKLFHNKFNTPEDSNPEELTQFVRDLLREKFVEADAGITGANFLIADTGAVCITENEGNAMMSMSLPRIHIAVAGIEKLIPSLEDLHYFWPMLASKGTGQKITVYNSIITGPRKPEETDGPEEMYMVLIDNNRSSLLAEKKQKIALGCIRCGACLNGCPVYRNIGGYTYATTYSGPIGSVISPHLHGFEKFKHLSFASSLCGNCSEVCPVKIPIHELLLHNREKSVREGHAKSWEKVTMLGFKHVMKNRKLMNMGNTSLKNYLMKKFVGPIWGPRRDVPRLARKSFNEQWKKSRKK